MTSSYSNSLSLSLDRTGQDELISTQITFSHLFSKSITKSGQHCTLDRSMVSFKPHPTSSFIKSSSIAYLMLMSSHQDCSSYLFRGLSSSYLINSPKRWMLHDITHPMRSSRRHPLQAIILLDGSQFAVLFLWSNTPPTTLIQPSS